MYQKNLTQANIETIFRTNFLNCMNDYGLENIPLLQHYDYVKKGIFSKDGKAGWRMEQGR